MHAKKQLLSATDIYRQKNALKARKLPPIKMHSFTGPPSVYYLAPQENRPSGGVRVIYRHVDILNFMGIPAAVVHPRPGFRCSWFHNATRVTSIDALRLREVDILVVPEFYGVCLNNLPGEARKVVFNQGPHHTFDLLPIVPSAPGSPYTEASNLKAILTVSKDGAELLRLGFPQTHIGIARNVIDPNVFFPAEGSDREQRICYVRSRRSVELQEILHFLNCCPEVQSGEWKLVELCGLSELEMAAAYRASAIFMSLSDRDGFGLPPAEAMACGSYVVGYPGGGGREYFDPAFCAPSHSTTELLTALVGTIKSSAAWRKERGEKASAQILGHYTAEGLVTDLADFYGGLL